VYFCNKAQEKKEGEEGREVENPRAHSRPPQCCRSAREKKKRKRNGYFLRPFLLRLRGNTDGGEGKEEEKCHALVVILIRSPEEKKELRPDITCLHLHLGRGRGGRKGEGSRKKKKERSYCQTFIYPESIGRGKRGKRESRPPNLFP